MVVIKMEERPEVIEQREMKQRVEEYLKSKPLYNVKHNKIAEQVIENESYLIVSGAEYIKNNDILDSNNKLMYVNNFIKDVVLNVLNVLESKFNEQGYEIKDYMDIKRITEFSTNELFYFKANLGLFYDINLYEVEFIGIKKGVIYFNILPE